jgi:cathepsin L
MGFVAKFGKSYYSLEEFNLRKSLYLDSNQEILRINAEQSSHVAAHNKFSDYSVVEYSSMFSLKLEVFPPSHDDVDHEQHTTLDAALTIDWRTLGKVSAVSDQGRCAGCFAFSAVGAYESARAILGYELV